MKELTLNAFREMLRKALVSIKEKEDYFSLLDAHTGDGDHGTAIVAAFSVAVKISETATSFDKMLNDIGFAVITETSGSTSTLLGAMFLGMSDAAKGEQLNIQSIKDIFAAGLANVKKQTKAEVGDKTMMDALIPAVVAMQNCDTDDVADLFSAAATAAVEGSNATIDMVAKYGRARNYGERSKGFIDSGAASWSTMFVAFASTF
jgi:dihydroxyacetone kinase-like protein